MLPVILLGGAAILYFGLGCSKANFDEDKTPVTVKTDDLGTEFGLDKNGGLLQDTFKVDITFPAGEGGEALTIYTTNPDGYGGLYYQIRNDGETSWNTDDTNSPSLADVLYIKNIKLSNLVDNTVEDILVDGKVSVKDISVYDIYTDNIKYPISTGFLNKNVPWLKAEITLGLDVSALSSIWVAKVYEEIAGGYIIFWDSSLNEYQTNGDICPLAFCPSGVWSMSRINSQFRVTLLKDENQDPSEGRVINKK